MTATVGIATGPRLNEPAVILVVLGIPAPQGSKRHVGNGILVESSKKVRPWRDAVRSTAALARPGLAPLDGPLRVSMCFTFLRPRSHYRTGRNADLLRDGAPTAPQGTPDLSKLVRSTEDALTDAGVWVDDARVVALNACKVYANEYPDALSKPGAVIRVWTAVTDA